ncbi:hypothetical protein QY96_03462 [Bacillus thermotolerans]|nr:hypothetical protein QY96_03462 [Bacillus thermotolerans]
MVQKHSKRKGKVIVVINSEDLPDDLDTLNDGLYITDAREQQSE